MYVSENRYGVGSQWLNMDVRSNHDKDPKSNKLYSLKKVKSLGFRHGFRLLPKTADLQFLPTSLTGHKARFAFRVFFFLIIRRFICVHTKNLAGRGPGFDSKSEQLTSTTIQTDPRQRTSGPVPIRLLMRSPEVTLCLWHAMLIKRVTVPKRCLKNDSPPP